jgi:DnaJ-class molecular chaperone
MLTFYRGLATFFTVAFLFSLLQAQTNVSFIYELGGFMHVDLHQRFFWEVRTNVQVSREVDFSLEEAFTGKTVELEATRKIVNRKCMPQLCDHCSGLRSIVVSRHNPSFDAKKKLLMPCPYCGGTGFVPSQNCDLFTITTKNITAIFPAGVFPGFALTFANVGDETVLDGERIETGDLVVSASVQSTERVRVTQTSVQYSIEMTPQESLTGFVREDILPDGQYLKIDRRNRVTLPGFQTRLDGYGFPKVGGKTGERTALIVTFSLEPERKFNDDLGENETHISTISNQEELNAFLSKSDEKKKDAAMRSILAFLKEEDDRKSAS